MDDTSNIRKDNTLYEENVETSNGRSTPAQNDLVLRLEERIMELQGELEQDVEGGKSIKGLNYEDLCILPDVELPEGYKHPKFEMFNGTGDLKVHLRTYCDKLVGVGKDERIHMKLFMRSLTGDALSWYISQNPKKWVNWVSMASDFMDRFRFNTENAPDVFYIQNLKKNPTETFPEYATRWRSEDAKVRPTLEEEQMNKFFIRAQDPQYYERLMVIENHKFSDIIKLGERIEEGIKSGMVTNFKALQATNKALQSGGISKKKEVDAVMLYERLKAASYVTPIPVVAMENSSQRVNSNKTCAYHSGMKGHTIDECCALKDKIHTLIDTKVIQAKEVAPNRRETGAAQGMTRTGRVYTPEHLEGTSKGATSKQPIIESDLDDLWRKISILSLLQNSEAHRNALMKVLKEAYVPNNITSGEMDNMVGQVLESHKITLHEDEFPPEGLSHNRALHITMRFEDKFIARVLIDRGSSLNIFPLTTLKRLGKGLHEIRAGTMNVNAFDRSQRATIEEINLFLQMASTWFDVEFQEVIIHEDGSNPIYTNQIVPVVENKRKLGGETYYRIERINAIEKDKG
ncbi:uncharacterized protein [Nicotiana sylvestris]|uniref:uncharacterized protein n=1 Tax=Nicotiana sylvestris TaxID=4096 RepID=UPI00388C744E